MAWWDGAREKRIKEYAIEHVLDLKAAEKRLNEEDRKKAEAKKKKEKEHSLKAQRTYRERHGEDLKKARRVAYSLMSLRKEVPRKWSSSAGALLIHRESLMISLAATLSEFLSEGERDGLMRELSGEAAKMRSEIRESWSKELQAQAKRDKKKYDAAMRKIEGKPAKRKEG